MFRGPSAPFFDLDGNPLPSQEGRRLLKNDLLSLILTMNGERVRRPEFGTQLRSFTMEQMTPDTVADLRDNIIQSIHLNDPRFSVNSVDIKTDYDNHTLNIKIDAAIVDDPPNNLVVETSIKI